MQAGSIKFTAEFIDLDPERTKDEYLENEPLHARRNDSSSCPPQMMLIGNKQATSLTHRHRVRWISIRGTLCKRTNS